jgi:hypothetical protein
MRIANGRDYTANPPGMARELMVLLGLRLVVKEFNRMR